MSSLNDFFASKSLTTECVLSSNEISYSLKSLIDTEAANYSFINELIAQNVCDHLQIKSLSLIKLKSIRKFNDHYAKKSITHAIYSNLTVQDHMKHFVFMLITRLDQHQMILEKTWMNKIKMTIDMKDDHFQFSSFKTHIKAFIKAHSTVLSSKKIIIEQKSSTSTQILKRFISSVVTQLSKKSSSYSKTLKKHKWHVWLVLHRLREIDLQMNINKCKFHVQKIFFLRLLLFIEELKINLRKVQAVVEWSTSTNLIQMQFFVNFCNFYQRFIKNFSKIVHSLIQLTQKEMIFEWDQACQMIFDHMKKWMTEVFILRHFDQNKKTILETDSFNYVNDDILSQYDDEETLHLMIYYSKNLSLAECNYEIYDKKLLAIICIFKHWRSELKLTELLIKMFTDHQALTSLMKDKELSRR